MTKRDIEKALEELALHYSVEILEMFSELSFNTDGDRTNLGRYKSHSLGGIYDFYLFCQLLAEDKYGLAWRKMTGTNFRGMELIPEKMNKLMCRWIDLK